MYSRKFNGVGVLPPDYSGVALRDASKEQSQRRSPPEGEVCRPRHPVFENDSSDMPTYPREEHEPCRENEHKNKEEESCREDCITPKHRLPFTGRNFTIEDIILAGLLLLIMNDEETDSGLLIILGLLLLVGM